VTRDPERRTEQTHPVSGEAAERLRQFTLLAPGSLFAGRYRIETRIGGGGAGEVYRALDELSQATVAIKVLFPRGDDPQPLERLRRELRLLRGLSHPGIVRIHDIGEHGGLLFLVMDLLEGETLRARLQRGPLPPD
jgi:serine/threonine-protein kinase